MHIVVFVVVPWHVELCDVMRQNYCKSKKNATKYVCDHILET